MKIQTSICEICHDTLINDECHNCHQTLQKWDKLHTIFSYKNSAIRQLYHLYKFKNSVLAEKDLVTLLSPHWEQFEYCYFIIAPCSKETHQRLGFNPVTQLVKHLTKNYCEPFQKVNPSLSLKKLDGQTRKGTENTIRLISPIPTSTKLILIDDIFTTGSTLNQAGSLLKESGINYLEALCFLRS